VSRSVDDTYDVYDEREPRARKEHRCKACGETIRIGDRYANVKVVFDGTAETIKRCLRCQRMHEHLRTLGDRRDRLWPDEQLNCGEEYEEHWGKKPPDEIAALAFALPGEVK